MMVKVIQEITHPEDHAFFGLMTLDLDKKDKGRHLVVEGTYEQSPAHLFLLNKVAILQAPDCRPICLFLIV